MEILVTGGLGFIGSHTVVELLNENFKVIVIDNLSNSSIEVLDGIERIINKRHLFVLFFLNPLVTPVFTGGLVESRGLQSNTLFLF